LLIQKDLNLLFDYVEPSDTNLDTYSFRIHELLLRTCVEIEANFKAILTENGYRKSSMNILDYHKINASHRLSSYEIRLPLWTGHLNVRRPFENWQNNHNLPWYTIYNNTKHDRHSKFSQASFLHLTDAVCALVALLSAQFWTHDYSPADWFLSAGGPDDGFESAIGSYFRVKFPTDWPISEQYDFEWHAIRSLTDPFANYTYN
jgi:hypothetical protein